MSIKDGPGEGTWSVFAMKVVEERDALREEVARLKSVAAKADEEATMLANSALATTEQVIHTLRRERDEAYAVCEMMAAWWHKHGIEATKEIDEIAWQARGVVFKKKGPEKP